VPEDALLGKEGEGFYNISWELQGERLIGAAGTIEGAKRMFEAGLAYANERKTFGKPLGKHQVIRHALADMATEIEAARQLVYRAAWLKDQGRDYGLAAAQAKLFASEVSSRATNSGIQIHGGYGYVTDYPVERFMRDAKLTEIGEGTSQVQRLVIARRILNLRVV